MKRTRRLAPVAALVAATSLLVPSAAMAAAPSNDRWDEPAYLPQVPAVEATRTGEATVDPYEHRPCGDIGKTVWYSFFAQADQVLTVNTFGSNFDTVLAVYSESTVGSGASPERPPGSNILGACNDDAAGSQQSKVKLRVAADDIVYIQAGGLGSASGRLGWHRTRLDSSGRRRSRWSRRRPRPARACRGSARAPCDRGPRRIAP